uniref:Uncharacterized protein n=1 Tax=Manihot esculenta TaxID=3983 RepID=A0A2C9VQB5_MANES
MPRRYKVQEEEEKKRKNPEERHDLPFASVTCLKPPLPRPPHEEEEENRRSRISPLSCHLLLFSFPPHIFLHCQKHFNQFKESKKITNKYPVHCFFSSQYAIYI